MAANEKEILRGTIVLDVKQFMKDIDDLPKKLEARANTLNNTFVKMGKNTEEAVNKIIVPLKNLQDELGKTNSKILELAGTAQTVWKTISTAQRESMTDMRRTSKENLDKMKQDFQTFEQQKNSIRNNDLKAVRNQAAEELRIQKNLNKEVENSARQKTTTSNGIPTSSRSLVPINATDIVKVDDALTKVNKRLAEAEKNVYALYRAGAQISQLSFIFTVFASAVVAGIGSLVSGAENFDTWTRKARAAGLASGEFNVSVKELQTAIIDLGSDIGSFDPTELAQAFYFWQSAVGTTVSSTEELTQVLKRDLLPVLQATALADVPVAVAIKGITSALGAFRLGTDQASHAAQVMLAVTQLTNSEFADVIQSFAYVGAGAQSLGLSLEEVSAVFGRLSDLGLRGGQAGRALQQMLASIVDPSDKATKALKATFGGSVLLGTSWEDLLFPGGKFVGILDEITDGVVTQQGMVSLLADRMRNLTEKQKDNILAQITTNNAYRALAPLIQDAINDTDSMSRRVQNFYAILKDNPAELFGNQLDTYSGGIKETFGKRINEIKGLLLQLGIAAQYALIPFLEAFSAVIVEVRKLAELHPEVAKFLIQLVSMAAISAVVAGAMGLLVGNITSLAAVMKIFPIIADVLKVVGVAFLRLPLLIAPIVAAITLLWVAWQNNWGNLKASVQENGQAFLNAAKQMVGAIGVIVNAIRAFVRGDFAQLETFFKDFAVHVLAALLHIAEAIGPALVALMRGFFQDLDNLLSDWFGHLYTVGRDAALHLVAGIRTGLSSEIQNVVQTANQYLGGIGQINSKIAKRAFGGYVQPGEVTLVGERGPELVVLPAGAQVIPNHSSMGIIAKGMAAGSAAITAGTAKISSTGQISVPNLTVAGQAGGTQYGDGFESTVDLPSHMVPGPLYRKALEMGQKFGESFIKGFNAADFDKFNALFDTIAANIDDIAQSGAWGSGADAAETYISELNLAIATTSQLVAIMNGTGVVTEQLYLDLTRVAGGMTDDILALVNGWKDVSNAQKAIGNEQGVLQALQGVKGYLDQQKTAIEDIIYGLNQQKIPYQDQLKAIEKTIEGLNRQKRVLELQKEPLQDMQEAIDEVTKGLQRSLQPLEDAIRTINLQKQGLQDIVDGYDAQIEAINRAKQALEDQKLPIQDILDGIDRAIDVFKSQKDVLEQLKEPLDDAKTALQDQVDLINEGIKGLQDQLDLQKEKQSAEIDPAKAALEVRQLELTLAREAEDMRRESAADEIKSRQEALDAVKERVATELDGIQAGLDARQKELDQTKARFALEEEIAKRKTEEAGLLGASQNVIQFLQFQEAALKKLHAGAIDPAEARLQTDKDLLEAKKKFEEDRLAKDQKNIDRQSDLEKRKEDTIDRQFKAVDRSITAEDRRIAAREREFAAENKIIEDQIKIEDKKAKNVEKDITAIDKQLTAIDRREKAIDREIANAERTKSNYEDQIKVIDQQIKNEDRRIHAIELEKQNYTDQIKNLDRQAENISRQEEAINHAIELENRKKDLIGDQIATIDKQEKLLDRQIAAANDSKQGPTDAIANIDEQIASEQKKADAIARQSEMVDRQIKDHEAIVSSLEAQKKAYEDVVKNAQALHDWHVKINDLLQKQKDALGNIPKKADPADIKFPSASPQPGGSPNPLVGVNQGDVTSGTSDALLLAQVLWEKYTAQVLALVNQPYDKLSAAQKFAVENSARFIGTIVSQWTDPKIPDLIAGIWDKIATRFLNLPKIDVKTLFNTGDNTTEILDFKEMTQRIDDFVKMVPEKFDIFKNLEILPPTADDYMKTFLSQFDSLGNKVDDVGKKLISIKAPEDFGKYIARLAGSGDDIAKVATHLDDVATAGSDLFKVFEGGKDILSAGGPLGWFITIALDLIIVFVKNWDAISKRLGDSISFMAKELTERFKPVFDDLVEGTKTRLEPAFRNLMIVLGFVDEVIQVVIVALGKFWDKMGPFLGPVMKAGIELIALLADYMKRMWFILLDIVGLNFGKLGEDILALFGDLGGHLEEIGKQLQTAFKNFLPAVWEGLKAAWPVLWESIKELFGHLWEDALHPAFTDIKNKIGDTFSSIGTDIHDWFVALPGKLKLAIAELLLSLLQAFVDWREKLFGHSIFPDLLKEMVNWFKELPNNLLNALGDFVGFVSAPFVALAGWVDEWLGVSKETGLRKMFMTGFDLVKTAISKVIGLASAVGSGTKLTVDDSTILGAILGPFVAVFNWINETLFGDTGLKGAFKAGWDAVKGVIDLAMGKESNGKFAEGTILGALVNPLFNIIKWLQDNVFGSKESKTGLIGAFFSAFDTIFTVVRDILTGSDGKGGLQNIFTTVYDKAIKPMVDAFVTLKDTLGKIEIPESLKSLMSLASKLFGGSGGSKTGDAAVPATGGASGGGPVQGPWTYTQGPGNTENGGSHGRANAIDLAIPVGTPLFSVGAGRTTVGYDSSYGNFVDLTLDDGNTFRYGHLSQTGFTGKVANQQAIGSSGNTGNSTGPHLHFEHMSGPNWKFGDVYDWVTGGERLPLDANIPRNGTQSIYSGSVGAGTAIASGVAGLVNFAKAEFMKYFKSLFGVGKYENQPVSGDLIPSEAGVGEIDPAYSFEGKAENFEERPGIKWSGSPEVWIYNALKLAGVGTDWFSGMYTVGKYESGFDPNARNDSDDNAKEGHPSMGIAQTIAGTFNAYHVPGRGYIWNPIDNLAASIKYIMATYGHVDLLKGVQSVNNGGPWIGYKDGLFNVPNDGFAAMLHKNEMVVPADFAKQLRASLNPTIDVSNLRANSSTQTVVNNYYQLTVQGNDKAVDPEANKKIMDRMAFLNGGTVL